MSPMFKIPVKRQFLYLILLANVSLISCSTESTKGGKGISDAEKRYYSGKGVGPVKKVILDGVDTAIAASGKVLFGSKCVTCHNITDQKLIGPGLKGVTLRRTPEWIMNQILNPIEMAQSDSLAKELLAIYYSQMTPMGLSEQEARSVLEYFRFLDDAPVAGN